MPDEHGYATLEDLRSLPPAPEPTHEERTATEAAMAITAARLNEILTNRPPSHDPWHTLALAHKVNPENRKPASAALMLGDGSTHTLALEYAPGVLDSDISRWRIRMIRREDETGAKARIALLSDLLVAWDVVNEGAPHPPTVDAIAALAPAHVKALLTAIFGDINGTKAPTAGGIPVGAA